MINNSSTECDFMPEISLDAQKETLKEVECIKILGLTFTSDMKWHDHES